MTRADDLIAAWRAELAQVLEDYREEVIADDRRDRTAATAADDEEQLWQARFQEAEACAGDHAGRKEDLHEQQLSPFEND